MSSGVAVSARLRLGVRVVEEASGDLGFSDQEYLVGLDIFQDLLGASGPEDGDLVD